MPASPRQAGRLPVQKRVHSLAVDPRTHRVYAPEQEHDGAPVARMVAYRAIGDALIAVRTSIAVAGLLLAVPALPAAAQSPASPELRVGLLPPQGFHLDGVLDEPAWNTAPAIANLTMSEPRKGDAPSARTRISVLADAHAIVIGILCEDPDPAGIVSFTKQRDALLEAEDHVTVVLDTVLDGRSGYVFQVNPSGARYDALINPGGGDANADWDGIWDAAVHRDEHGWSVEIWIPIPTLTFKRNLDRWHFNVERRIQRRQEVDRWASAAPDWTITQTNRAGLLSGLPAFDVGLGLTVRPAGIVGGGIPSAEAPATNQSHASLDVRQRLATDLNASVSVNTDFAETEADAEQINLTRFPLFFPEKRTFFLEGSDIFQFGLGAAGPAHSVLQPPGRPLRRPGSADRRRHQAHWPRRRHQHRSVVRAHACGARPRVRRRSRRRADHPQRPRRIVGRPDRDLWRSVRRAAELARRIGFHVPDVPLPRESEFSRGSIGGSHESHRRRR